MTTIRARTMGDPWGLTDVEHQAVAAYVEHGDMVKAMAAIGSSQRSIENALSRARRRMQVPTTVRLVAEWVKWKTQQQQPAEQPRTRWQSVTPCTSCHGLGFVQRTAR